VNHYTGSVPDTARAWVKQALCASPEYADERETLWFAPKKDKANIRRARQICWSCPALQACAQSAIDNREPIGLWGGITETERRAILRRRGIRLPDDREDDHIAPDTLRDLWEQRTQLVDGHMKWTSSTPVSFRGHTTTPQRIGFQLDRGRQPVGIVRRTCLVKGCVLPAHLADQAERDALRKKAAA
jgi:hypothetical protein